MTAHTIHFDADAVPAQPQKQPRLHLLPPVSDMFSLYRISLILVVALVLHDGVLVCCDEFETGPPFDEDEGLEECNDDTVVCEVSEAVSL